MWVLFFTIIVNTYLTAVKYFQKFGIFSVQINSVYYAKISTKKFIKKYYYNPPISDGNF